MEPVHQTNLGTLFQEDCLEFLSRLPDGSIDLVFADPPFNLGKDYGKGITDERQSEDYLDWCKSWLKECSRALVPGGAIFVYNIPRWNIEIGHILNDLGLTFRHWIAIDIKFGLPIAGRLYPSHYSLLYYTRGKPKTFNRPRVPIPTCRHCGGDIKDYGGHRNKLHPDGLNLTDIWSDIPPVRHRGTKRRGANELSEKLLARVLDIATAPGDVVLDPFGGSGTTYAVAEKMHRRWTGCELGDVDPIIRRLEGLPSKIDMPCRGDSGKGMSGLVHQRGSSRRAEQSKGSESVLF